MKVSTVGLAAADVRWRRRWAVDRVCLGDAIGRAAQAGGRGAEKRRKRVCGEGRWPGEMGGSSLMTEQATDWDKDEVNPNVVCRPGPTSFAARESTSLRSNKGGRRLLAG